ncbi:MAG: hypothetical protein EA342_11685 [Leptolyngbya sp. LCM1.Bin17]|nr:MAG: hypothetical protein EA342_11685 [Leptolyngbya sp. LCM1.Bin17]
MLGLSARLGHLAVGRVADISVQDLRPGNFTWRDNSGDQVQANSVISPAFCLRAGEVIQADSPAVVRPMALAS